MNPVRVHSEREFERLLDRLERDAHRALDHWQLFKGLSRAIRSYRAEMEEASVFWNLALSAHFDVVIFRLARLYDQESSGLGLKRFLLTVKATSKYFSESAVLQRLPGYPSSLARKINPSTLQNDIRRVSADRDHLVSRLWKLRNQSVSHVDPNPIRLAASSAGGLKRSEIETLLKRGLAIVTRYSLIYRASLVSTKVVGADDYLQLLDLLRRGRMSLAAQKGLIRSH